MKHQPIRMWRSSGMKFPKSNSSAKTDDGKDETLYVNDVYTDKELQKIGRRSGFNAIWVYGILRNMVKTSVFPQLGKYSSDHLRNMRSLIKRAGRYGIKVFIMTQEPRGIPEKADFWKKHPDVKGTLEIMHGHNGKPMRLYTLCSSHVKVKAYLKELFANLAQELPQLGGVMFITASEFPSHCWGNRGYNYDERGKRSAQFLLPDCPQCKGKKPVDVVNEVISLIHAGIRSVSRDMAVIASNWSWNIYEDDPSPTIIKNLPKDILLMPDFDRGGTKIILGKRREMDEYSISYSGPAKRFKDSFKLARRHGVRTLAKLQFGTTHELATVPNLPLIGNLYDKVRFLRDNAIRDFNGCWNFGNMISANTAAWNYFLQKKKLGGKQSELKNFAFEYFPECNSHLVCKAWLTFAKAMNSYPYCIPFLYVGPTNYALSYPVKPGKLNNIPCGRSWLPDKIRGDCLEAAFGPYTLNEIIRGFAILHREWGKGMQILEKGLQKVTSDHKREELNTAWCCYHIFRSTWNIYRTYKLRKNWTSKKRKQFCAIAGNEFKNLEHVLPIVQNDKRLGFHGEAFAYMFDAKSIRGKMRRLKPFVLSADR